MACYGTVKLESIPYRALPWQGSMYGKVKALQLRNSESKTTKNPFSMQGKMLRRLIL